MSIGKDVKFYPKVIEDVTAPQEIIVTDPIFTADHKSVEFSFITDDVATDCELVVAVSIQKAPPDIGAALSADNQFTDKIAYIDEENGATYNANSPYNPSTEGGSVSKIFRFNTNGAVWVILAVQAMVAGHIVGVNVTLSDNI